jgi:hypothetical protein
MGSLQTLHTPDNTKGPAQGPFAVLALVTVYRELVSENFPVMEKTNLCREKSLGCPCETT